MTAMCVMHDETHSWHMHSCLASNHAHQSTVYGMLELLTGRCFENTLCILPDHTLIQRLLTACSSTRHTLGNADGPSTDAECTDVGACAAWSVERILEFIDMSTDIADSPSKLLQRLACSRVCANVYTNLHHLQAHTVVWAMLQLLRSASPGRGRRRCSLPWKCCQRWGSGRHSPHCQGLPAAALAGGGQLTRSALIAARCAQLLLGPSPCNAHPGISGKHFLRNERL